MNWIIYSLLSAVFASLVAILGNVGLSGTNINSTLATTVRSIIMAIFLIVVSLFTVNLSNLNAINQKAFLFIILSAIAGALSWLCYFKALQIVPTQFMPAVPVLDRLSAVFAFILAIIFLGVRANVYSVAGVALATVGAILMTIK